MIAGNYSQYNHLNQSVQLVDKGWLLYCVSMELSIAFSCMYYTLGTPTRIAKYVCEIDCQVKALMVVIVSCVQHNLQMYPLSLLMSHQCVTVYFVLYCKLIILAVTIKTKTHSHANSSSGN